MATKRRSKVFTISMPPEMAEKAQFMAARQNRTMSELMREAFRTYEERQVVRFFDEMGEYARSRPPSEFSEEDIPRLVKEVRAQMQAERDAEQNHTG